ncbi:MAG: type III-B CRISPR module-associated protein Cmr5 [Crenarchaeota archaeon]|nr:type III-B CRISPR module-associated protein Cmr5 [Thermoproteota archaeon]
MSRNISEMVVSEDIVALKVAKIINNIVNIFKDEGVLKHFRTRARQLYEALVYQGLYQITAYCAGKAGYAELMNVYNTLTRPTELREALSKIKDDEGRSYALYGAVLLRVLTDVCNLEDLSKLDIDKLLEKLIEEQYLEQVAYMVAKWIKLCAEALIKREERQ